MRVLTNSFLLVLFLGSVSGCASSSRDATGNADAMKAKADANFNAYLNCMKSSVTSYSASSASPHEIADAAQSKCGAAFRAFESSLEEQLTYDKVTNVGHSAGLREARRLAQDLRISAKEKAVQWAIESRLQKK